MRGVRFAPDHLASSSLDFPPRIYAGRHLGIPTHILPYLACNLNNFVITIKEKQKGGDQYVYNS